MCRILASLIPDSPRRIAACVRWPRVVSARPEDGGVSGVGCFPCALAIMALYDNVLISWFEMLPGFKPFSLAISSVELNVSWRGDIHGQVDRQGKDSIV